MATGFNTQIIDGMFHLQFETEKREYYEYVQAAARDCLDGKATDKCHRWISVKERLPEDGQAVIVVFEGRWCMMGWRSQGEWYTRPTITQMGVTHWIPLPEAPKEE